MNALGRVVAIMIVTILIFLYPIQYVALNQHEIVENYINSYTAEFAEEIIQNGYLTKDMYSDFMNRLYVANRLYNVEIIHGKSVTGYGEEVINVQNNQILHQNLNQPVGMELDYLKGRINQPETLVYNQLLSSHVHTDACYSGHRHTESCYTINTEDERYYHSTLPNVYGVVDDSDTYSWGHRFANEVKIYCDVCDNQLVSAYLNEYQYASPTYYNINSVCINQYYLNINQSIRMKSKYTYQYLTRTTAPDEEGWFYVNGVTPDYGWGSETFSQYRKVNPDFDSAIRALYRSISTNWSQDEPTYTVKMDELLKLGFNTGFGCPYCIKEGRSSSYVAGNPPGTKVLTCMTSQDEVPLCSQVVLNLNASNQEVTEGNSINTNAIATYLDGHTGMVNCTSNYKGELGSQLVILTYTGLVDNAKTHGSKTCNITVITKPKRVPVTLEVTPSNDTVFNGSEPTYTVKVIYSDHWEKIITTGYTKTDMTKGAGIKNITFTYYENGITITGTVTITVKRNIKTCEYGHTYELDDYDTDFGCTICKGSIKYILVTPEYIVLEKGEELHLQVTVIYYDGHSKIIDTGWSSNYNPNKLGNQLVTISYGGKTAYVSVTVNQMVECHICKNKYPLNIDGTDSVCPICKDKVISILATPAVQTVQKGDTIELEVSATYADGHEEIVDGWSSSFNSFKVGTQQVTVYYKNVTTKVTVIVTSDSVTTCSDCNTDYNPIIYPGGCPKCAKIIVGIEARLRNGGTKVQLGSDLNLSIIITYQDGHRSIAYDGFSVEGYNSNVLGMQTILVNYHEFHTTLSIEIVNSINKSICDNGHTYYLNEDGSDPGCPYCLRVNGNYCGEDYYECIYTKTILQEIYTAGIYYFKSGDFITITVTPRNKSIYENLQKVIYKTNNPTTKYSYGGQILG